MQLYFNRTITYLLSYNWFSHKARRSSCRSATIFLIYWLWFKPNQNKNKMRMCRIFSWFWEISDFKNLCRGVHTSPPSEPQPSSSHPLLAMCSTCQWAGGGASVCLNLLWWRTVTGADLIMWNTTSMVNSISLPHLMLINIIFNRCTKTFLILDM